MDVGSWLIVMSFLELQSKVWFSGIKTNLMLSLEFFFTSSLYQFFIDVFVKCRVVNFQTQTDGLTLDSGDSSGRGTLPLLRLFPEVRRGFPVLLVGFDCRRVPFLRSASPLPLPRGVTMVTLGTQATTEPASLAKKIKQK